MLDQQKSPSTLESGGEKGTGKNGKKAVLPAFSSLIAPPTHQPQKGSRNVFAITSAIVILIGLILILLGFCGVFTQAKDSAEQHAAPRYMTNATANL